MNHPVYLYIQQPDSIALSVSDTQCLNAAEQARAQAFRFADDRRLYTAAHVFLRQTLSLHSPLPPSDWQFTHNAWGKPFIANPDYAGLHFNLSHTKGLLAVVISPNYPVGVDVEGVRPMHDLPALCATVLVKQEAEHVLSAATEALQQERFFTYWSLKEAYIKAQGQGLSIPLQQFSFRQIHYEWRLQHEVPHQGAATDWQFMTLLLDNTHCIGLAVRATRDDCPQVHINPLTHRP